MNYIYTDGSCINNGKANAKAGIGIFFNDDDERNLSEPLDSSMKQTNNTAELCAIIKAIKIVKDDNKKYIIYKDSNYSILCSKNYEKWIKTKKESEIPNIELVKELFTLIRRYPIQLEYIEAHTSKEDIHSYGNDKADKLANNSIGLIKCDKKYLEIPFKNKDEAKKLGAKWDNDKKNWYYFEDNINKEKLKNLEEIIEKVYLNVQYRDKDLVKKLGAKWDKNEKLWYYTLDLDSNNKLSLNKFIKK